MRIDGMATYALGATAAAVTVFIAYKATENAIDKTERWQAGTLGLAVGVPGAVGTIAVFGKLMDAKTMTAGKVGGLVGAAAGAGLLLGAGFAGLHRYDELAGT